MGDQDGEGRSSTSSSRLSDAEVARNAVRFSQQAEKLSHEQPGAGGAVAVAAHLITPQDAVIVTSDNKRLPGVPLQEAHKLNVLREEMQGSPEVVEIREGDETKETIANTEDGKQAQSPNKVIHLPKGQKGHSMQKSTGETLRKAAPPSHTNPLFPPLPLYGPSSVLRDIQCLFFRFTAFFLSLVFLMCIVLGSLFTSVPIWGKKIWYKLTFRNLDKIRPFYEEELQRAKERKEQDKAWSRRSSSETSREDEKSVPDEFHPTEGGKDPLVCDVGYYARRVGLDVEEFKVQTEDGFIIDLWHVFDPKEYAKLDNESREDQGPTALNPDFSRSQRGSTSKKKPKFPVLLMHGLLQSSGAYCCNDDNSLAFWLCKSGYDVWLGNNRCGFEPKHVLLKYSDPRMWCWNIRQMGVFDLPALTTRVLSETGFEKVGLICHSQGTTQTFVALAKEQRPDLGEKLTVFCALAPAAYAGPLIGKMYFKFMRLISPSFFRIMFGIHAFIPFMMQMHAMLPPRLYGWMGYKVFSFLFDWSDTRWDRGLRDRMFQFAPVYVSAESMRWWLGRECFAKHKCILATKEAVREEERLEQEAAKGGSSSSSSSDLDGKEYPGSKAWYNHQAPPFAVWACGSDDLVDGPKLLQRLKSNREPYAQLVHSKIIPDYEHLDVLWAMDAPEQVFAEVREVLWKTCHARDKCRVPVGCENVEPWVPDERAVPSESESDGSRRPAGGKTHNGVEVVQKRGEEED